MATPEKQSYWQGNFGFQGADTGDYINQFTSSLGIKGKFEDTETYIKGIFDTFDKDKGGTIDQAELGMVMRACGKNPSDNDIVDMLNEIDQDQNGKIDFSEFTRLIRKIQSGNMVYVATSAAEAGPGRAHPPAVDLHLLQTRQASGRSRVSGNDFNGALMGLKNLDDADKAKSSGGLAELTSKIRGINGGIDIRGHLSGISQHNNGLRGEHNSLGIENRNLVQQNNALIQYIQRFEQNQGLYIQELQRQRVRIGTLEQENLEARGYIGKANNKIKKLEGDVIQLSSENGRLNQENLSLRAQIGPLQEKVIQLEARVNYFIAEEIKWNERIRERETEINRLNFVIQELSQWKVKYEGAMNENSKLVYRIEVMTDQIRNTQIAHDKLVAELNLKISEWQNKWNQLNYDLQRLQSENVNLKLQVTFLRTEIARINSQFSARELEFEALNGDWLLVSSQCENQKVQIEAFWKMLNEEHDMLKSRLTGFLQTNIRERMTTAGRQQRQITKQELMRKIMVNTIEYCAKLEGNDVIFDKFSAWQCASQILTNAHGLSYEQANEKLDHNNHFNSVWEQCSKHSDGKLHKEHYNAFFKSILDIFNNQ